MRRILLCQSGANDSGSGLSMLQVARGLRDSGCYEPYLLFSYSGPLSERALRDGYRVIIHPLAAFNYSAFGKFRLGSLIWFISEIGSASKQVERTIKGNRIDIVYINTSAPVAPALVAHRLHIPVVWHVREALAKNSPIGKWQIELIKNSSDIILANSDFVAGVIGDSSKTIRIYNGVPLALYEQASSSRNMIRASWGLDDSTLIIGQVGVISRSKGCFTLVDSARLLSSEAPSIRFVMLGKSSVPQWYSQTIRGRIRRLLNQEYDPFLQLKAYIEKMGLSDQIILEGWREDIPEIMSAIDILVFPSLYPEGFGRPLIEAGAAGRPVIASNLGPSSEIIIDKVTGLLIPPGEHIALAQSIKTLIQNPDLRYQMGLEGKKRVALLFSEKMYLEKIMEVFKRISG